MSNEEDAEGEDDRRHPPRAQASALSRSHSASLFGALAALDIDINMAQQKVLLTHLFLFE